MAEFVKQYNNDPFVGNLSTPVTTSTATKIYLGNLPIYRKGLTPLLRGLEIGMAHGYFLIGPFYILGPLRNSENALLVGMFSALGLIIILTNNYYTTIILHNTIPGIIGAISALLIIVLYMMI